MKLLTFLLRYSKANVGLAVLVGAFSGACSAGLMVVINNSLNSSTSSLGVLGWQFVGLVALALLSNYVSRLLLIRLSQSATYDMRIQLCRQVLASPLRSLEEIGAHRIMAALTQDINIITGALLNIPVLFIHLAVLIGCLIYLGWLSSTMLVVLLVFLVLSLTSVEFIQNKGLNYIRLAREEWDKLVKHFQALTGGTKELKLHHERREAFLAEWIQVTAMSHRQYDQAGRKIYAAASSWSQILYFAFIGLVVFVLPRMQQVSFAALSGYVLTVLYMRAPILMLMDLIPSFKTANVSLQKVKELGLSLENLGQQDKSPRRVEPAFAHRRIDLLGVTHTFYQEREERNFVLGPIDLSLNSGELVFLIGSNGSGKTTFAKLLSGLYTPEAGEIWLDGEPVTDENRERYRQLFTVVFSDFYLFEQLLGLNDANLDGQAQHYLNMLHLDHKVEVRNGLLSTTELSRGQRKRLALLTAYLEDRPFYIFDEWAADQDPIFKEIFYRQLLPELKARGKTVLAITHDDKYFHIADRVIKLDYGQLSCDQSSIDAFNVAINIPSTPQA